MKRNQQLWGAWLCRRAHYCGYISWGVGGVTRSTESNGRGAQVSKTFFTSIAGYAVFDRGFCFFFERSRKKKKKKRFPRYRRPFPMHQCECHRVPQLADLLLRLRPANVFHLEWPSKLLQGLHLRNDGHVNHVDANSPGKFRPAITANLFLNSEIDGLPSLDRQKEARE